MSERVIVVIQARMTSTRLPGKVMLPLCGAPLVQRVIERARRIPGTDGVCLAIPPGEVHAPLHIVAKQQGVDLAIGPEEDVLARYVGAADQTGAKIVMRVTSDCPLIDPQVCGEVLTLMREKGVGCARTAADSGYPIGLDTEVMRRNISVRQQVRPGALTIGSMWLRSSGIVPSVFRLRFLIGSPTDAPGG